MLFVHFSRSLYPAVAGILIWCLISPSLALAAITGAYDNSGAGSKDTIEEGAGQKADDPCDLKEPIKKTDSENCKELKRNNITSDNSIEKALADGIDVDVAATKVAISKGLIDPGQVVDKNGELHDIFKSTNTPTGINPERWARDISQVETGPLDKVLKDATKEASGSVGAGDITLNDDAGGKLLDTNAVLEKKQAEIKSTLNELNRVQKQNEETRSDLQLIPDQSAVEQDHIKVDKAIAVVDKNTKQTQQLSDAVTELAEAQNKLNNSDHDPNSTEYKVAQSQINEALERIQNTPIAQGQSYNIEKTSLGDSVYIAESIDTDIVTKMTKHTAKIVDFIASNKFDSYGNPRFDDLEIDTINQRYGESYAGPKGGNSLNEAARKAAVTYAGYKVPKVEYTEEELDKATRIALAEGYIIKNESGNAKTGNLVAEAEIMRNRMLSDDFPDTLDGVLSQGGQFEVVTNGKYLNDAYGPNNPNYEAMKASIKSVLDGESVPTAVNSKGQAYLNFGNNPTIQSRPEASKATKASFAAMAADPDSITFYSDKNSKYQHTYGNLNPDADLPSFKPDHLIAEENKTSGSISTQDSGKNTYTMAELGIKDFDSIPDLPAPPDGWGGYAGVDDVHQTINAFSNKTPEEFVIGTVAADNVGINVFTADTKTKTEVVDSTAKLIKNLNGTRSHESDVTVNGFSIDEQVQIAVTEYNLKYDRNLSVDNHSEMGPLGSHRHRDIDDTTYGQGCACAVDVAFLDENGNKLTIKENEDVYREIAKNFTQNTGGAANYETSYMGGRNAHFDVAHLNPMRTGVDVAYTDYARKNERDFGKDIRDNLEISYEYATSEGGKKYVKNYRVAPKGDTNKETITIGDNSQKGKPSGGDNSPSSPGGNSSGGKTATTRTDTRTYGNPIIDSFAPLITLIAPKDDPGVQQFLGLASGMFQLVSQVAGTLEQNSNNGIIAARNDSEEDPVEDVTKALTGLFDTSDINGTNIGKNALSDIVSQLPDLLGVKTFAELGTNELYKNLNSAYQTLLKGSAGRNDSTNTATINSSVKTAPQETIPVTVTVNDKTRQIEFRRDDILSTLGKTNTQGGEAQEFDDYYKMTQKQPLILDENNKVVYSNGLYAPATDDFAVENSGDNPVYVYLIKRIDENGDLISSTNSDSLPDKSFLDKLSAEVFGNNGLYAFEDIIEANYEIVDPNKSVPRDEYNKYVISLTDGTSRTVTVPEYTNIATLREQFFASGYRGNVIAIMNSAREIDSAEAEQKRTLARAVIDKVAGAFDKLVSTLRGGPDGSGTFTDLTTVNKEKVSDTELLSDNLLSVYVYPNAPVSCPDIEGYNSGYVYDVFLQDFNDPDSIIVITDENCAVADPIDLAIAVSIDLKTTYGFKDLDTEEFLSRTYLNFDEIQYQTGVTKIRTSEIRKPDTDVPTVDIEIKGDNNNDENVYIPNTTNTVSFEVKVLDSNGGTNRDWTSSNVSISSGEQLIFRWDANDYSQCLVYLNDNGLYALKKREDARLVTGNTEEEGFDVSEYNGSYRIECGGQGNGEFGVDARQINVSIQ